MHDDVETGTDAALTDVREYCRRVEDYLTRANGGHLIRIVGPAFALVRGWADAGVPIGIVTRGIDARVERHRASQATRPLRIEFCAHDVDALFERWRRAVGLPANPIRDLEDDASDGDAAAGSTSEASEPRRGSLAKHLGRAIDRLAATSGRLDLAAGIRDAAPGFIEELAALRDRARTARGAARDAIAAELPAVDRRLADLARASATDGQVTDARREADEDLAAYRGRLLPEAWQRAMETTIDQRLRARLGLPVLEF